MSQIAARIYSCRKGVIMIMSPEILKRLLKGEHLTVDECKTLNLLPRETLSYNEALSYLTEILESSDYFPKSLAEAMCNGIVPEGIFIENKGRNCFVCIVQRTLPDNPRVLAERAKMSFNSAQSAAEYYLKWELHLPGRLDGWRVLQ